MGPMILRLAFDWEDLQRVRLASGPDVMWEIILGLNRLRDSRIGVQLSGWQRQTRVRLRGGTSPPLWQRTLFTLVPYPGSFPDFLTPAPPSADIGAACEAIASTARQRLRRDLTTAFPQTTQPPGWIRELAAGNPFEIRSVVDAVHAAYDLLVAPHWDVVQGSVSADRTARTHVLAHHGVGALLTGIPGFEGWDGQVLKIRYPRNRTVRLAGRGLTLVPSYFCVSPVSLIDPDLPPILVYPIVARVQGEGAQVPRRLVALLGQTRAECLAALVTPCTTTTLAERLGMSVGNASKQAAVLREAGLAAARRQGRAVLHHLTHLGEQLLVGTDVLR
jgi:DNA-binding transcriptional ArsR family regulator